MTTKALECRTGDETPEEDLLGILMPHRKRYGEHRNEEALISIYEAIRLHAGLLEAETDVC